MRTFFLAIIICASLCLLKAQSVSMNMDIEWKQKNVYLFDSIGMTKVPFLRICFTNNTSDSLYFYGLKSDSLKYINLYNEDMLISYTNGSVYPDLTDYLTSYKTRESGNNFNILINKFNKTGYSDWILFKDKDDTSMKISDNKNPKISWKINTIAQMLEIQDELNLLDTKVQLRGFNYPNKRLITANEARMLISNGKQLLLDSIQKLVNLRRDSLNNENFAQIITQRDFKTQLDQIRKQYIYLKPYGSFVLEYDLTPLYLIGGNYNFMTQTHLLPNSVEFLNPFSMQKINFKLLKSHNKGLYFKFNLPPKYMGYKMYKGKILGNKINLSIN